MTAVTNAGAAVTTLEAAYGVVVGDYLEANPGWGRLNDRFVRIKVVSANDVTLGGVHTSSTLYPAGTMPRMTSRYVGMLAGVVRILAGAIRMATGAVRKPFRRLPAPDQSRNERRSHIDFPVSHQPRPTIFDAGDPPRNHNSCALPRKPSCVPSTPWPARPHPTGWLPGPAPAPDCMPSIA
ncbi:MAG: hypothetical protein JNK99_16365 [Candidatus Accumulibacter sp.]|nr:hypothetical protein [Accumulibacter sp.]